MSHKVKGTWIPELLHGERILRNTHMGHYIIEKSASVGLTTKIWRTQGLLFFYHIEFANHYLYFKRKGKTYRFTLLPPKTLY